MWTNQALESKVIVFVFSLFLFSRCLFSFCVTEKNEIIYSERGGLHVLPGDQVSVHDHVHRVFFTGCRAKKWGVNFRILRLLANYCFCVTGKCHLCTSRRNLWQNPRLPKAGWRSRASARVQTLMAAKRTTNKKHAVSERHQVWWLWWITEQTLETHPC